MAKSKKIAEPLAEVSEEVVAVEQEVENVEVVEEVAEVVEETPEVEVQEPVVKPHVVVSKSIDEPLVKPEFLPKDTVEFYNKRGELCYAPYAYIAKRGYTALRKYTKK